MLRSAVRGLFRRSSPLLPETAPVAVVAGTDGFTPLFVPQPESPVVWPAARLALNHQLWGQGFIFPGGEIETLRLARPLGVSASGSLLIAGAGSGGPACTVASNLGAWVTAVDTDPSLLAAARRLVGQAQLGKKIVVAAWDPDNPTLGQKTHHHCLALEPFRGPHPEPILDALTRALKPGGHIVIAELTAPEPLDGADPTVRRWTDLEYRDPAQLLAPVAITRMLKRLGLDVRVVEDISQRHLEHAMLGWRVLLRDIGPKPDRHEAAHLVREAELWLLRRRLIRDGRLRMMRWHAIGHAPVV